MIYNYSSLNKDKRLSPLRMGLFIKQLNLTLFISTCLIITVNTRLCTGMKEVLDTSHPILIAERKNTNSSKSFFGYSVSLAKGHDRPHHPIGWVFIGAPKSNTSNFNYGKSNEKEPGVIWRCRLGQRTDDTQDACEMMRIDPSENRNAKSRGGINPVKEDHSGAWIGVTSEINHDRFVTCGSRWKRGNNIYYDGICYWFADTENQNPRNKTSYRDNLLERLIQKNYTSSDIIPYDQRLMPFFRNDEIETYFNFTNFLGKPATNHEWQLGQAGLSTHLFIDRNLGSDDANLLIGAPGVREWSGAVILYTNRKDPRKTTERTNRLPWDSTFSEFLVLNRGIVPEMEKVDDPSKFHWLEYFGWSVSAGKYLSRDKVLYAAGAPRANHCGAVIIFTAPDPTPSSTYKQQIKNIVDISAPPNSFGSYFGSVIYSGDFDANGLDELIVGAPTYSVCKTRDTKGNENEETCESQEGGDHGCVFIYKFKDPNNDTIINKKPTQVLCGSETPGSRFGSAISSITFQVKSQNKNIKKEIYLVVGAPYETFPTDKESSGAVYLYMYNMQTDKFDRFSQRITASQIRKSLNGFGSTISIPQDIDNNKSPDLAIGAFKSGHAVVLRTRPRIALKGWIEFPEYEIRRGSKTFTLKSCFSVEVISGRVEMITIRVKLKFSDSRIKFENQPNNEFTYVKNVQASIPEPCEKITFTSTHPNGFGEENDSDKIEEVEIPFFFIQEVKYNDTLRNSTHPTSVLKIYATEAQRDRQQFDFSDFKPKLPSPEVNTSTNQISVSLSDCLKICFPEIHQRWNFFYSNKSENVTSHVIGGSLSEIRMQLVIHNTGQTAKRPMIQISWENKEVIEGSSGTPWLHANCKDVSDSTGYKTYDKCSLSYYIRKDRNITIILSFNMNNVFAETPHNFQFIVKTKIDFEDENTQGKFEDKMELQLTVPKTQAIITGSRNNEILREPKSYNVEESRSTTEKDLANKNSKNDLLYAPFRQGFRIEVQGAPVKEAIATFKIPVAWNSLEDNSKQIFLVKKPETDLNIVCNPKASSKFSLHLIKTIKSKPVSDEDGSDNDDVADEHESRRNLSEQPIPQRRRREISPSLMESANVELGLENGTNQISQDFFLPQRQPKKNITHSEGALKFECSSEIDCLEVECKISYVKPNRPVHITFEMFPVKERIDNLLKAKDKTALFVQSNGLVEIFRNFTRESHYLDIDVTVTVLTKISSRVQLWIYFAAGGGGIFVLACIVLGLFKCGFFKRKKLEELKQMKAEHHRKSMIASAARASMMVRQSVSAADGFESRENLTEAEHHNEDLEEVKNPKSEESLPAPNDDEIADTNESQTTEVEDEK